MGILVQRSSAKFTCLFGKGTENENAVTLPH